MAGLRIRVELNKGRVGIPLGKLALVADRIYRFFGKLCEDVRIEGKTEAWLAQKFENGSVAFDITNLNISDVSSVSNFKRAFRRISDFNPSSAEDYQDIPRSTFLLYAKIADPIDADEKVSFGLYAENEEKPSDWYDLTKEISVTMEEFFKGPEHIFYQGEVHGVIHSLIKESGRPHLRVRDLCTGRLIQCFYRKEMYREIVDLLKRKDAVVYISGAVSASWKDRTIESISAEKFHVAEEFADRDFIDFFGCAPDITGKETTEDFISGIREEDAN